MPVVVAFLIRLAAILIRYAGPMVLQALAFFGLSFVTQHYAVTPGLAQIQATFHGLPSVMISALAGVNLDRAITIILSAYTVRAGSNLVLRRRTS